MTGGLDCVVASIEHALEKREEREVPCCWSEGYIRCIGIIGGMSKGHYLRRVVVKQGGDRT
jgi:hypothetical protein